MSWRKAGVGLLGSVAGVAWIFLATRANAGGIDLSLRGGYTESELGKGYEAVVLVRLAPERLVVGSSVGGAASSQRSQVWFGGVEDDQLVPPGVARNELVEVADGPVDLPEAQWLSQWASDARIGEGAASASGHMVPPLSVPEQSVGVGADRDGESPRNGQPYESSVAGLSEGPGGGAEPAPHGEAESPRRTSQSRPAGLPSANWVRQLARRLVLRVRGQLNPREARLDSLAFRSRSGALLPLLRLKAGRSADQSLRYAPTTSEPDRWVQTGAADLRYEAQATWALDRLVFTHQELGVERFRQQAARERRQRVDLAIKLLFRWQRARLRLAMLAADDPDAFEEQLVALEAEVGLDALTAGWFGKQVRAIRSVPD